MEPGARLRRRSRGRESPRRRAARRGLAKSAHAEQILGDAVRIAPNDPQSWFRYGVLTASARKIAAERIRKAITLDPWLPDQSRRLGELTHAEPALKDALRTDPFDDAAWDLGGRIMAEKGKFRDAFFDFEGAIKIYPSGQYLYDYALALVRADCFDDAQKQTEMALRADEGLVKAHELFGGLYARKKDLPAASAEYAAALALKPLSGARPVEPRNRARSRRR
jgi:tetratricopeptide (TPR) repeat protein